MLFSAVAVRFSSAVKCVVIKCRLFVDYISIDITFIFYMRFLFSSETEIQTAFMCGDLIGALLSTNILIGTVLIAMEIVGIRKKR